jgi:hypothetical protein
VPEEIVRKYLFDNPGFYQIRVWGIFSECWLTQLDGLSIKTTRSRNNLPVTQITGWLADQPALTGLLDLLSELGMIILTVKRLEVKDKVS